MTKCIIDVIPAYRPDGWGFVGWFARCRQHREWYTGTYTFRGLADALARRHISDNTP